MVERQNESRLVKLNKVSERWVGMGEDEASAGCRRVLEGEVGHPG
jgi:hypothetical protein